MTPEDKDVERVEGVIANGLMRRGEQKPGAPTVTDMAKKIVALLTAAQQPERPDCQDPGLLWREREEARGENARLREALRKLAEHHHRLLTNSRFHDPERIESFVDCPCKTCRNAALALSPTEPREP